MNKKTYWVGVLKSEYDNHEVFSDYEDDVTPEKYPNFDYTIGPFFSKKEAVKRAKKEKNLTGTFTDPFCNHGQGR